MTDMEKMEKLVMLASMYSWLFYKSGWFQYLDSEKQYTDAAKALKWHMFENGTDRDAVTKAWLAGRREAKKVCKGRVTVRKAKKLLALVDKLVSEVKGA